MSDSRILVAITGASGTLYAERLVEQLLEKTSRIYIIFSETGKKVCQHECSGQNQGILSRVLKGELSSEEKKVIRVFENDDLFAPLASGSSSPTSMVLVPCSMGTVARVAQGVSSNLIERAADVVLKQKRQLIVCPREMPFNLIHLKNLTSLAEAGAEILPLMPGFYQNPKTLSDLVDFCVGKVLEQLNLSHELYKPWNKRLV